MSFNLLSEILFVQASLNLIQPQGSKPFQSLERDSVCSSRIYEDETATPILFQSLERDSVCSSQLSIFHNLTH